MANTNTHDKMSNVQEQMAIAVETAREAAHSVTLKVTDFFQGNPFETPIGRKIELATDATILPTENWGLIMEICDFINNTDEGARDAARAIRKRLQTQISKNNAIIMFTLTVLETCIKNCNQRFKAAICQKDFINELIKLIAAKFDAPQIIQERVLSLIQSWADAFRGNPALCGVVEVYDELKKKGVEFPPMNFDSMAPIITPKRTVFTTQEQQPEAGGEPVEQQLRGKLTQQQFNQQPYRQIDENVMFVDSLNGPVALSAEQLGKLRSEIDVANVNLMVLRDLLGVLTPNRENVADFELLQQLYITCFEMQKRAVQLVSLVSNEEVTYELLTLNDEFNTIFEKYSRYMTNRNSQCGPSGALIQGDLIDLNAGSSSSTIDEQLSGISIHGSTNKNTSSHANNYVHDQTEAGIRTAAFNKTQLISEREAHELVGWLNADKKDETKKPNESNYDGL